MQASDGTSDHARKKKTSNSRLTLDTQRKTREQPTQHNPRRDPAYIRKRNGRPKILPPENVDAAEARAQDPRLLRAIARAWGWRRKIETGEVATIHDIAVAEKLSERFVSRTMRLAYLSPIVLEKLVTQRRPCSLSIKDLERRSRTSVD